MRCDDVRDRYEQHDYDSTQLDPMIVMDNGVDPMLVIDNDEL